MDNVAKKKMGRPIVGQPKDVRLTIRVSEENYQKLLKRSEKLKISQSELIRKLIEKMK